MIRWRRFITKLGQENSDLPIQMSPGEWALLTEDSSVILASYPVVRAALLRYIKPLMQQYFEVWSLNHSKEYPDFLLNAEKGLLSILTSISAIIVRSQSRTDSEFIRHITQWALELLIPLRSSADRLLDQVWCAAEPYDAKSALSDPKYKSQTYYNHKINYLLDFWSRCPVLCSLLPIVADCLTSPFTSSSTIKSLIELSCINMQSNPNFLQQLAPHWVLNYLLIYVGYSQHSKLQQRTPRSGSTQLHSLYHLVDALLSSAIEFPDQYPLQWSPELFEFWDKWLFTVFSNLLYLSNDGSAFLFEWFDKILESMINTSILYEGFFNQKLARLSYVLLKLCCFKHSRTPKEDSRKDFGPIFFRIATKGNNVQQDSFDQNQKSAYSRTSTYKNSTEKYLGFLNNQAGKLRDYGLDLLQRILSLILHQVALLKSTELNNLLFQLAHKDCFTHMIRCLIDALAQPIVYSSPQLLAQLFFTLKHPHLSPLGSTVTDIFINDLMISHLSGSDSNGLSFLLNFKALINSDFIEDIVNEGCIRRSRLIVLADLLNHQELNSQINTLFHTENLLSEIFKNKTISLVKIIQSHSSTSLSLFYSVVRFYNIIWTQKKDSLHCVVNKAIYKALNNKTKKVLIPTLKNILWIINKEFEEKHCEFLVFETLKNNLTVIAQQLNMYQNDENLISLQLNILEILISPESILLAKIRNECNLIPNFNSSKSISFLLPYLRWLHFVMNDFSKVEFWRRGVQILKHLCSNPLILSYSMKYFITKITSNLKYPVSSLGQQFKYSKRNFNHCTFIPDDVFTADHDKSNFEHEYLLISQSIPSKPTDVHHGSLLSLKRMSPDEKSMSKTEQDEYLRRWVLLLTIFRSNKNTCLSMNLLGEIFLQSLLKHGVRIPQTTIPVHQSFAPLNVAPPSGLGLEWSLDIIKTMLFNSKDSIYINAIKMITRHICMSLLHDFSELLNSYVEINSENSRVLKSYLTSTYGFLIALFDENKLWFWMKQLPQLRVGKTWDQLPAVSLYLSLLQGLEASWTGPLAPRATITDDSLAPITEGLFQPTVNVISNDAFFLRSLITKIGLNKRSVDTNSNLYQCTGEILSLLQSIFHSIDYFLILINCPEGCALYGRDPSFLRSAPCLLRLTRLITPRELAILISDVRRNMRLRSYLHLRESITQKSYESCLPHSFLTLGLANVLSHVYIRKNGVAESFGWLTHSLSLNQNVRLPSLLTMSSAETYRADKYEEDTGLNSDQDDMDVQTIDIDGERLVVVAD